MEQDLELHQLNALTNIQNSSLEQISFIAQNLMEESILEEDFPSWDDYTSESEADPSSTSILDKSTADNQDTNHINGDLGDQNPGQGT
jgi:hypothetical protein